MLNLIALFRAITTGRYISVFGALSKELAPLDILYLRVFFENFSSTFQLVIYVTIIFLHPFNS